MQKTHIVKLFKSKQTIFTLKEIALLWGDNNVKRKINYYVKTKKLIALRKGIYAKDKDYDLFEVATKIYTPSYISFETILYKEGIIFQFYNTIFIASYLARKIKCDGKKYDFKKIKNTVLLNPLGLIQSENYYIASKERAFLDTLYLYKEYGFDNLKAISWDKCFEILPLYENKRLNKAVNLYYKNYARNK